jgi:hypothetical protein
VRPDPDLWDACEQLNIPCKPHIKCFCVEYTLSFYNMMMSSREKDVWK